MNQETSGKVASQDDNRLGVPIQPGLFEFPVPEGLPPSLLGNRCTNCEKTFFPKRSLCPHCFDKGPLEDIALDRYGVIYVTTIVHVSSPSGIKAPYVYGYVDIPVNGLRVCTLFAGDDPKAFMPGRDVELVIEPFRVNKEGIPVICYKYKLIPE